MAMFTVVTDEDPKVKEFFLQTSKRLQSKDLVKNAFKGKIYNMGMGCYIISLKPVYFEYYKFGFVFMAATLLFRLFTGLADVWTWFYVPGLVIACTGFFYSNAFYRLVMKRGLRKIGYKGKILFSNKAVFRRLTDWDK